ncbi:hypothetical protein SANTM175S_09599 [Streptomyces antimycoticus]
MTARSEPPSWTGSRLPPATCPGRPPPRRGPSRHVPRHRPPCPAPGPSHGRLGRPSGARPDGTSQRTARPRKGPVPRPTVVPVAAANGPAALTEPCRRPPSALSPRGNPGDALHQRRPAPGPPGQGVPAIAAAGIGATGLLGCSGSGDTAGHDAEAAKAGKAAEKGVTSRDSTSAPGRGAPLLHRATEAEAAVQAAEGTGPEPGASAPPPPDGLRRTGRPGAGLGSRSRRWAPSSSSPGARQASSPSGRPTTAGPRAARRAPHPWATPGSPSTTPRRTARTSGSAPVPWAWPGIRTWPTARRTSWAGSGTAPYRAPTAASPTASR